MTPQEFREAQSQPIEACFREGLAGFRLMTRPTCCAVIAEINRLHQSDSALVRVVASYATLGLRLAGEAARIEDERAAASDGGPKP